jgi:23S rRNA (uridine2552-2'-O)-methyltransferase
MNERRVRNTRGRTVSSLRWLERQLSDPYVAAAKAKGYRSRAAFKLKEMDQKFHLLKRGGRVLDLGAAPGGWSQIARERVGDEGKVVAIDIQDMELLTGVEFLQLDMLADDAPDRVKALLGGEADVVLSDMASPTTGHRETDHVRTLVLFETAFALAVEVLKPGGSLVGKVFQGGAANSVLNNVKKRFAQVKHVKPPASRAESVELYLVAMGFKG